MHISLLIYWFLTRSLWWAKKAILHFVRLCWLLLKMTQGLLFPSPTPSHRKGDGGGVSLGCESRAPLLSKEPPAAASQTLTTCGVHWGHTGHTATQLDVEVTTTPSSFVKVGVWMSTLNVNGGDHSSWESEHTGSSRLEDNLPRLLPALTLCFCSVSDFVHGLDGGNICSHAPCFSQGCLYWF